MYRSLPYACVEATQAEFQYVKEVVACNFAILGQRRNSSRPKNMSFNLMRRDQEAQALPSAKLTSMQVIGAYQNKH